MQTLNNGGTFGTQRGKINNNFDELDTNKTDKTSVLTKTNTDAFTPTGNYHPVTKLYADSLIINWQAVYNPQGFSSDVYDRANHTGSVDPDDVAQNSDNRFVTDALIVSWNAKEDGIGVKGTAFNKNFGSGALDVSPGNHSHTKADVGLEFADNTSDINKGISTLQQAALDLKADQATTYTETEVDDLLDFKRDLDDNELASAIVGDGINNITIDSEGRATLNGNARVRKTVEIAVNGIELHPTQSPIYVNYRGSRVVQFSGTASQTLYFAAKMPYNYDEGTDVEFQIFGTFPNGSTGDRIWEMTHSWANEGDVFPTESTIQKTFTVTQSANINAAGSFGNINGSGKEIGSILLCSLTRRGDIDASNEETIVTFADFHYLVNKYGEPI